MAPELLFWDTKSGKQIKSAPSVANVWDTYTCTPGWPVQGNRLVGWNDINAVDLLQTCLRGKKEEKREIAVSYRR